MEHAVLIRSAFLLLPVVACFLLEIYTDHTARQRTSALFAGMWGFLMSLILAILAERWGGVRFNVTGTALYGVPVDIMLGIGFGVAASSYFFKNVMLGSVVAGLYTAIAYCFVDIHEGLAGLCLLAVSIIIIPAFLLAKWTETDTRVYARSFLQTLIWSTLLLWLFPSVALIQTGGSWGVLSDRPVWQTWVIFLPLVFPVAMISNALYVFAKFGNGTGFPYDPPKRLVTAGVYAYISNPMQTGICLTMFWWGIVLKCPLVIISSLIAVFLFIVFKDVCNGSSNLCGDDPKWREYQKSVPKWFPRRK